MPEDVLSSSERRVVSEIVRLTVSAWTELEPAAQARVHADVARFVALQVSSMPTFLRWPYRLAILAFNLLAVVRYARPFVSLREESKGSYLAFWSGGRIGPMRDFVKLIRSCAVLAYFDHAEVRRALDARRVASEGGGVAERIRRSAL